MRGERWKEGNESPLALSFSLFSASWNPKKLLHVKRERTDVRKTEDPKYPSNHVMIFPGSVLPKFTTKIKMIFLFEHFSSFKDEIRYHPCVNVNWKTRKKTPCASLINSSRALSYSSSSMVTITSTCSSPVSSLNSSMKNKACRDSLSVPSVYKHHRALRAEMFSAWTLRITLPSAICISLTPAGRTQVLTAVTNWSYVQPRLSSW